MPVDELGRRRRRPLRRHHAAARADGRRRSRSSPRSARSSTTRSARAADVARAPAVRRPTEASRSRSRRSGCPRASWTVGPASSASAGAPFTLACYLIEGRPSRDYATAKAFMYARARRPGTTCMERLSDDDRGAISARRSSAGASASSSSTAGSAASGPRDYRRVRRSRTCRRIFDGAATGRADRSISGPARRACSELMAAAGGDVIGRRLAGHRSPTAWARIGRDRGDPGQPRPGPAARRAGRRPRPARGRCSPRRPVAPGHVFNLGHGVLPGDGPGDRSAGCVDFVHEQTARTAVAVRSRRRDRVTPDRASC